MMCTVTVRRIKPGAYDTFRKAWEPDAWWPKCIRAEVLRNDDDPQQVMTLGYFDATPEEFDALAHDDALLQGETRRLRANRRSRGASRDEHDVRARRGRAPVTASAVASA